MSLHSFQSVIGAAFFALATLTHAQIISRPDVVLAQDTMRPADPGLQSSSTTNSTTKIKKPKRNSESRPGRNPHPAPAGGAGPPDPGKYL